jgi:hypothetical protein
MGPQKQVLGHLAAFFTIFVWGTTFIFTKLLLVSLPVSAQNLKVSRSPRELGTAVLRDLWIRDGKISFRVDSNGCTDAGNFKVRASREEGITPKAAHYRLTIQRVRIDECKAILWEGVEIEMDLAKDLGLTGTYTVSVSNPVLPKEGAPADSGADLQKSLLAATVGAIKLEIEATRQRLKAAEGTAPKQNVERFRQKIRSLEAEQARFGSLKPAEYPAPLKAPSDPASVLESSSGFGPVLPPVIREVTVRVEGPCAEGALLPVEGASKSGPFYHLAGIAGGDYAILKPGKEYRMELCLVYRREYFGLIGDFYAYVLSVR